MKILVFAFSLVVLPVFMFGQTIDKTPMYDEGIYGQRLTIEEMGYGKVHWMYQNPDYTHIIDIVSFTTSNAEESLLLLDECIRILSMDKTGKENHIRHNVAGVSIVRYGFAQKKVYLDKGLQLTAKQCLKIKERIMNYEFTVWKPLVNVGDSVIYIDIFKKRIDAVVISVTEGSDYCRIEFQSVGSLTEKKSVKQADLILK